ncbi:MAG: DUF1559 domain-containing protein [Phycisphaera sp.]|nr:DUF1559 domain-containing protein [Phycisphaera sp.]
MSGQSVKRSAFTLVELLVVISIIVLLIAVLLPALGSARYKARIVSCKSQTRQMAIGVTNYAVNYNGYYPDGGLGRPNPAVIFWNGSNGNGTAGGPGDFDFRNSFREYFGTKLNKIMKCPLVSDTWLSNANWYNIDTTGPHAGMVKTPFVFYFGPACTPLNGSPPDTKWQRSAFMRKLNDTWSPGPSSMPALQYELLLSDVAYWNGYSGEVLLVSHRSPDNTAPEGGNWTDHNIGYAYDATQQANGNFSLADGSVSTYDFSLDSITAGTLIGIRRQTGAQTYVVPRDIAR